MTRYVHTGTVRDRQHPGRPCATTTRNVIVTGLPGCNELVVISSGSVPNGTGFCSVTNPDLHLVMLMTERVFFAAQTNVMRIVACWKGVDLMGAV